MGTEDAESPAVSLVLFIFWAQPNVAELAGQGRFFLFFSLSCLGLAGPVFRPGLYIRDSVVRCERVCVIAPGACLAIRVFTFLAFLPSLILHALVSFPESYSSFSWP